MVAVVAVASPPELSTSSGCTICQPAEISLSTLIAHTQQVGRQRHALSLESRLKVGPLAVCTQEVVQQQPAEGGRARASEREAARFAHPPLARRHLATLISGCLGGQFVCVCVRRACGLMIGQTGQDKSTTFASRRYSYTRWSC